MWRSSSSIHVYVLDLETWRRVRALVYAMGFCLFSEGVRSKGLIGFVTLLDKGGKWREEAVDGTLSWSMQCKGVG